MNETTPVAEPPQAAATLEKALEELKSYSAGSSRSILSPIDESVIAALLDPATRKRLEQQLVLALNACAAPEAAEYVCSKLTLLGTAASVGALSKRLGDSRVSTAARNALEKIPAPAAATALREASQTLSGIARIGVIQSLGNRRDPLAVALLRKLLRDSDAGVVSAAAFALGEIGTIRAAAALKAFLPQTPMELRRAVADAALTCAGHLLRAGQASSAKSLSTAIADGPYPAYIRRAAASLR